MPPLAALAPGRSGTRCRSWTQSLAGSDESGLSYERAVALLGFTDASLLDEIVDAPPRAEASAW